MGKHSSSIAYHNGFIYLAYYEGEKEGPEQSVRILAKKPKEDKWRLAWHFQKGSGNPVLFRNDNTLWLACTQFRDEAMEGEMTIQQMWANTDMYLYLLAEGGTEICTPGYGPLQVFSYTGCRCAAYQTVSAVWLPTYNEFAGVCTIHRMKLGSSVMDMTHLIKFPDGHAIQPTLFVFKSVLFALARNFNRDSNQKAYVACLQRRNGGGMLDDWSYGYSDFVKNNNESILAIPNEEGALIVYNELTQRKGLVISQFGVKDGKKRALTDERIQCGSYPNYCMVNGDIYLSFTAYEHPMKRFNDRFIRLVKFNGTDIYGEVEYEDITEDYSNHY